MSTTCRPGSKMNNELWNPSQHSAFSLALEISVYFCMFTTVFHFGNHCFGYFSVLRNWKPDTQISKIGIIYTFVKRLCLCTQLQWEEADIVYMCTGGALPREPKESFFSACTVRYNVLCGWMIFISALFISLVTRHGCSWHMINVTEELNFEFYFKCKLEQVSVASNYPVEYHRHPTCFFLLYLLFRLTF